MLFVLLVTYQRNCCLTQRDQYLYLCFLLRLLALIYIETFGPFELIFYII